MCKGPEVGVVRESKEKGKIQMALGSAGHGAVFGSLFFFV